MRVDVWSDVACPWCYIGKRRFERALKGFPHAADVDVVFHSFQLDPTIPDGYPGGEVDYLVRSKGMPEADVRRMLAHVTEQAAGEGLAFAFDRLVVANTLVAHRLLHLAARHGRAGGVKEALLAAHFVDGRDVADPDTLVDVAVAAGLDADEARAALDDPALAADVQADFDAARRIGVTGVPFYVFDSKYAVSGAQPPDVFAQALERAWAEAGPLRPIGGDDAAVCGPDGCAI